MLSRIYRGRRGRALSLLFCNHLLFSGYFQELQTVLIKVKVIINNALLTYVYPNTIKTILTPNYLLIGRQLLCYSNTTWTVVRDLTVLSSTTDETNHISNHFWHRWRPEYVVHLRETQRASKLNINSPKNVLIYDEMVPRHFWRIAIVTGVLPGRYSEKKRSDSEN